MKAVQFLPHVAWRIRETFTAAETVPTHSAWADVATYIFNTCYRCCYRQREGRRSSYKGSSLSKAYRMLLSFQGPSLDLYFRQGRLVKTLIPTEFDVRIRNRCVLGMYTPIALMLI